MTPETVAQFISQLTVFGVFKWFFIAALLVYLAFAVIIVRQVGIMNEALDDPRNPLIAFFSWVHLLLTILLIVVSIVLL